MMVRKDLLPNFHMCLEYRFGLCLELLVFSLWSVVLCSSTFFTATFKLVHARRVFGGTSKSCTPAHAALHWPPIQEWIFRIEGFKPYGWYLTLVQFGFYTIFGLLQMVIGDYDRR